MHRPRWGVALLSVSLVTAVAAVAAGGAAHAAAASSFASSFEADDPQPTWTDSVEGDASRRRRGLQFRPVYEARRVESGAYLHPGNGLAHL